MSTVRAWISRLGARSRLWSGGLPSPQERAQGTARTKAIESLRAEIARLQQERLAVSQTEDEPGSDQPKTTATGRMATIERRLNDLHAELGSYQGRV